KFFLNIPDQISIPFSTQSFLSSTPHIHKELRYKSGRKSNRVFFSGKKNEAYFSICARFLYNNLNIMRLNIKLNLNAIVGTSKV
ncbi:MAG: hypothetical protein AB7S72_06235, partial [Draconibacterium sp.]